MIPRKDKDKVIKLRKEGLSYSEILRKVNISKSTLSLWLRSVGLSKKQKQRLTDKKLAAMKRGWEAIHNRKVLRVRNIIDHSRKEIKKISKRDLWLIGIALYWGEGHKEKTNGSLTMLGNSDPLIIRIYLKWLISICGIKKDDIHFCLFVHESAKQRIYEIKKYWSGVTNFSIGDFDTIYWKKNRIRSRRTNIGNNYYGLIRVIVRRSVNLNRKIQGWIKGICKYSRVE